MDLTDVPLFQDMTSVERDNIVFDLHNDFDCIGINYETEIGSLNIVFKPSNNGASEYPNLCLVFKKVILVKLDFSFINVQEAKTLNSFYRGRFENEVTAIEYSALGDRYFYIEFENGNKIELFSSNVLLLEI